MSERGDSAGSKKEETINEPFNPVEPTRASQIQSASIKNDGAASVSQQQPPVTNAQVYENTYRLKPERKFQSEAVRRLTTEILQNALAKAKYDAEKTPALTKSIANDIIAAVKKLDYDRYKIVAEVTIGEFKGQGIKVGSRAIWDTTTDSYASASFKNASLFAVALVFGTYFE